MTEVSGTGTKKRTFVYGMNGVVAQQKVEATYQEVRWEHTDPSNASYVQTGYNGLMYFDTQAELDPLGSNVGTNNPYNTGNQPDNMSSGGWGHGTWGDPFGGYSCMVDWIPQPCSFAMQVLSSGAGQFGPLDPIAGWRTKDGGKHWEPMFWERDSNGQLGYHSYSEGTFAYFDEETGEWETGIKLNTNWHSFQSEGGVWYRVAGYQQERYELLPEPTELRVRIVKRLDDNNGSCRNFLDSVLKNLGINKTMLNLFDEQMKKGGIVVDPKVQKKTGKAAVHKWGKKKPHPIGIMSLEKKPDEPNRIANLYINTIFHELLHVAKISGHTGMARAAFDTLSAEEREENPLPTDKTKLKGDKLDNAYDRYFTSMINKHCNYDPK